MSLHALLHEKHPFSNLRKLIQACVFSERKLKTALKNFSRKPEKPESPHSTSNSFLGVSSLYTGQKVDKGVQQNADFSMKILYEYEFEDLPLLINDKELNNFQLTIYRWRLQIGK